MWRSGFPFIYSSIYLQQGGGVVILGEASRGALHSSTLYDCVRKIIPFHNLFLVFFSNRTSAEERRSGYEDVIFGCEHRSLMIRRSFVDAVSRFKMICNSEDQPEYPLSTAYSMQTVCFKGCLSHCNMSRFSLSIGFQTFYALVCFKHGKQVQKASISGS